MSGRVPLVPPASGAVSGWVCTAFLIVTLLSGLVYASPEIQKNAMARGSKSLTRTVFDSRGGFSAAGVKSLSDSLCQPGSVAVMETGARRVEAGFFGGLGPGVLPAAAVSPDFITRYYQDWIVGVDISTPAKISFSKNMIPSSLAGAARVTLIRDDQAAEKNLSVAVSTSYAGAAKEFSLLVPSGQWNYNYTYRVEIATTAVDEEGIPLGEPLDFVFQTLLKPGADNIIKPPPGSGDDTIVVLKPGAIPEEGHIEISTFPSGAFVDIVAVANAKFQRDNAQGRIHEVRAVDFYGRNKQKEDIGFPGDAATLYIKYKDLNNDGVIDGGSPESALAANAGLYVLDEIAALWVRLPAAQVSVSSSAVYYPVPHLSYFAVGTALGSASAINSIYDYPSPFRPHGPNPGLGAGQTGTDAGGITFVNLPPDTKIEVYNIRGELVWNGKEQSGAGKLVWDTRTKSGQKAASGVYPYIVKTGGGKKTGKLAIIR